MSDEERLLEITEVRDAGTVRVRVRGELDLASAPILAEHLRGFRDHGERVVLDLDELAFIDMSGLRMLVAAAEDASRDGWALTITPGSTAVRRIVQLVHLDASLPFDGDTP